MKSITAPKINPEAEAAIVAANKLGFKFDLSQREHNYYTYLDKSTSVPIWNQVRYKLYKVQGTTWKIAMEPVMSKGNKDRAYSERLDLMWFDIDKKSLVK